LFGILEIVVELADIQLISTDGVGGVLLDKAQVLQVLF